MGIGKDWNKKMAVSDIEWSAGGRDSEGYIVWAKISESGYPVKVVIHEEIPDAP